MASMERKNIARPATDKGLEGQSHAAWVDEQRAVVLTEHLNVSVPSGHQGRSLRAKGLIQVGGPCGGKQVLCVRARRAVKQSEAHPIQIHVVSGLKRGDEVQVRTAHR